MEKYKLFCLFILFVVGLSSCREKELSDEDFINFARNIEKQMSNENEIPIITAFDYDEFEKRVLAGVDIPKKEKYKVSDFIRENVNPAMSILEMVMNGANFHFVNFYRKNNEPHIVFRTYFNGGVSLEEWVLGVKNGQIFIYDAFVIVSGIHWSDDCRQKLYNYLGIFTEEVMTINQLIEVNYLISNDNYAMADSLLYWIMPQMQNNMYARTIEMNLASLSKPYQNMQMLASEFEKTFPKEQRISVFYLMQSSIRHGLIDETTQHIYKLIDLLGDDPIYYVYQAWSFQQANVVQYALQMLDSAVHYMPYIFDLYLNKMDVYYSDSNYQACVDLLYQIDSLYVSHEEDVEFFQTNYTQLNQYEPFQIWKQSKGKTNY